MPQAGPDNCPVCDWRTEALICECCGFPLAAELRYAAHVRGWRGKWLSTGGRWWSGRDGIAPLSEEGRVGKPDDAFTAIVANVRHF